MSVCQNFERCSNFKIKTGSGEDSHAEHKHIRAGNFFSYLFETFWGYFFVTYGQCGYQKFHHGPAKWELQTKINCTFLA